MKKRIELTCHSCDLSYAVTYKTDDDLISTPDLCPFCGDNVEEDDGYDLSPRDDDEEEGEE